MFVVVGLVAAAVAFQVPMKAWQRLAPWLFIAGAVLLVLVLIPGIGKSVNGSRRWLSLVVDQPAAVRVHEARRRALRGELRGAQGGVPARASSRCGRRCVRGFLPLFAVMVVHRRPAAARAGLRRVRRHRRDRLRHPVPRRARLAAVPRARAAAAGGARRRSSSPRRTGCSGSSRSSTRGPIRSARATSCRTR